MDNVNQRGQVWNDVERCGQVWDDVEKCREIEKETRKVRRVWKTVEKSGGKDPEKSRRVWKTVEKSGGKGPEKSRRVWKVVGQHLVEISDWDITSVLKTRDLGAGLYCTILYNPAPKSRTSIFFQIPGLTGTIFSPSIIKQKCRL